MDVSAGGARAGESPACARRTRLRAEVVALIALIFATILLTVILLVHQRTLVGHAEKLKRLAACAGCSVDGDVAKATLRLVNKVNGGTATAFLHASGRVISVKHGVADVNVRDLELIDCAGRSHPIAAVALCGVDDLALLTLRTPPDDLKGLSISSQDDLLMGYPVTLLGYPAGYTGGEPLATVGHISGMEHEPNTKCARLVLNAAINLGNSGGPVLLPGENQVRGVAVAKLIPVPVELRTAIKALKRQREGVQYTYKSPDGRETPISEAQVLAGLLEYQQRQTQLAIGFAVPAATVRQFLAAQGLQP